MKNFLLKGEMELEKKLFLRDRVEYKKIALRTKILNIFFCLESIPTILSTIVKHMLPTSHLHFMRLPLEQKYSFSKTINLTQIGINMDIRVKM